MRTGSLYNQIVAERTPCKVLRRLCQHISSIWTTDVQSAVTSWIPVSQDVRLQCSASVKILQPQTSHNKVPEIHWHCKHRGSFPDSCSILPYWMQMELTHKQALLTNCTTASYYSNRTLWTSHRPNACKVMHICTPFHSNARMVHTPPTPP